MNVKFHIKLFPNQTSYNAVTYKLFWISVGRASQCLKFNSDITISVVEHSQHDSTLRNKFVFTVGENRCCFKFSGQQSVSCDNQGDAPTATGHDSRAASAAQNQDGVN
jgi:hypothetical protein